MTPIPVRHGWASGGAAVMCCGGKRLNWKKAGTKGDDFYAVTCPKCFRLFIHEGTRDEYFRWLKTNH